MGEAKRKQERLGSGPIEPQHRELMNKLAHGLDEMFNGELKGQARKVGFCLLVFNFDEPREGGRCNYISNAERRDVVALLKEQIRYFEGQPDTLRGTG